MKIYFVIMIFIICNVLSTRSQINEIKDIFNLEAKFANDSSHFKDSNILIVAVTNISSDVAILYSNPTCYLYRPSLPGVFINYVKPFYYLNNPRDGTYNDNFKKEYILKPGECIEYRIKIIIDDFFFKELNLIDLTYLYPGKKLYKGGIKVHNIKLYVK